MSEPAPHLEQRVVQLEAAVAVLLKAHLEREAQMDGLAEEVERAARPYLSKD